MKLWLLPYTCPWSWLPGNLLLLFFFLTCTPGSPARPRRITVTIHGNPPWVQVFPLHRNPAPCLLHVQPQLPMTTLPISRLPYPSHYNSCNPTGDSTQVNIYRAQDTLCPQHPCNLFPCTKRQPFHNLSPCAHNTPQDIPVLLGYTGAPHPTWWGSPPPGVWYLFLVQEIIARTHIGECFTYPMACCTNNGAEF